MLTSPQPATPTPPAAQVTGQRASTAQGCGHGLSPGSQPADAWLRGHSHPARHLPTAPPARAPGVGCPARCLAVRMFAEDSDKKDEKWCLLYLPLLLGPWRVGGPEVRSSPEPRALLPGGRRPRALRPGVGGAHTRKRPSGRPCPCGASAPANTLRLQGDLGMGLGRGNGLPPLGRALPGR